MPFTDRELAEIDDAAARRIRHADYCAAHPESLTDSLPPALAAAFTPLLARRVERRVEVAAAHRAATGQAA